VNDTVLTVEFDMETRVNKESHGSRSHLTSIMSFQAWVCKNKRQGRRNGAGNTAEANEDGHDIQ
jgi:hypothetical protein